MQGVDLTRRMQEVFQDPNLFSEKFDRCAGLLTFAARVPFSPRNPAQTNSRKTRTAVAQNPHRSL